MCKKTFIRSGVNTTNDHFTCVDMMAKTLVSANAQNADLPLLTIHVCTPKKYGIADLIGCSIAGPPKIR